VTNIGHTIRRRISSGAASPVQVEAIASELGVRGQVPATAVPPGARGRPPVGTASSVADRVGAPPWKTTVVNSASPDSLPGPDTRRQVP
jgi:hypothetical protein